MCLGVVLPHIKAVVEIRIVAVVGDPQLVGRQGGQVVAVVPLLPVHVDPGTVAAFFYKRAEGARLRRQEQVCVLGSAGIVGVHRLPIVVYRQIERAPAQQPQGVESLVSRLPQRGGL